MNRSIIMLGMLLASIGDAARAEEPGGALAVVVDRENPRSDITVSELKEIFQGKRKEWQDGARIIALDLEPGPAREAFNRGVLGMDQASVDQYWVQQKVQGGASPPKAVNASTALKLVPRVRGVITYIPLSWVDASVKVLSVGGLLPDQAGYPIVAR